MATADTASTLRQAPPIVIRRRRGWDNEMAGKRHTSFVVEPKTCCGVGGAMSADTIEMEEGR